MPVWFGVLLSSLASCMNALGLNLQRMASSLPNKNPNNIQGKLAKSLNAKSLNSIGICFSTMCGVVEGISLGYAPQSTLAPLGALTLVVNLLLAPVLHNEKITKSDSFLTLVIIIGVITCIMGGNADEQEYTVKDLHTLSQNSMFHKMIGILTSLFVILGLHVIMNGNKNKKASKNDKTKEYNSLSIGFVYPVVAGIFGGLTVLSVKILTIVGTSSEGIVHHWKLIVVLVAINLTFAIAQIIINGIGLSKHSALVMVPIYSSAFVLSNAMGGGIFFKEFDKLNERGVNMYMCGVSFVIFGVLSMAYIKHKEIEEQAANTKKEKDVIDLTVKDEVDDEELPKGIKKTKRSKSKGRTTPKSSSKKKTKKSLNTRGSSPELKISK